MRYPCGQGRCLLVFSKETRMTTNGRASGRVWALAGLVMLAIVAARLAPNDNLAAQAGTVRHRMTKITDRIYRADNPGTPGINATSWVFINDQDVLVTDSEGSPASARSLLAGIASVTD